MSWTGGRTYRRPPAGHPTGQAGPVLVSQSMPAVAERSTGLAQRRRRGRSLRPPPSALTAPCCARPLAGILSLTGADRWPVGSPASCSADTSWPSTTSRPDLGRTGPRPAPRPAGAPRRAGRAGQAGRIVRGLFAITVDDGSREHCLSALATAGVGRGWPITFFLPTRYPGRARRHAVPVAGGGAAVPGRMPSRASPSAATIWEISHSAGVPAGLDCPNVHGAG